MHVFPKTSLDFHSTYFLDMPFLQAQGIWSGSVLVSNRSWRRIAQLSQIVCKIWSFQSFQSFGSIETCQRSCDLWHPLELCSWDHHVPTNTQMDCCSPQRHKGMARGIALDLSRPFLKVSRSKKYVTPQLVMSVYIRRKFRSQTSDHLDKWKSRGEESERRREEVTRPEKRKEREERRCRCAKRKKSRATLCFSDVLGLQRVEK